MTYLTQDEALLRAAAERAVTRGRALGAEVSAIAKARGGAEIVVRDGETDIAVRDGHVSLAVTLFRDGRRGSATTTSLDAAAVARAVEEAAAIAGAVEPDADAGLADPAWLAFDGEKPMLFESDAAGPAGLVEAAFAIEAAAKGAGRRVTGAGAATSDGLRVLATSAGFCRASQFSLHQRWCAVLAEDGAGFVQDGYDVTDRRVGALPTPEAIARIAVERALAARGGQRVASARVPVMFEPRVAAMLALELVGALSGGRQASGQTFLPDPLGRPVAAAHLELSEDPFEPWGLASSPFDDEGVAGMRRAILSAGEAQGLFLDARSARKLGMASTGNANGCYNLRLTGADGGERSAMLRRLGTGLVVSELLGGATDPVRGGWTRAVAGFWVSGGAVAHPVRDITLAGEFPAMLRDIVAVGSDVERFGAVRTGSILIDAMQMGGAA
ncbi:MAG: metallopeptidase TldD-related protein [Sphingomonas phyllosphaerae]|uniref:TldD/PmbA family protein n=1 Tax=Sphingomonas phyllosphaerae TaxID=257003 RepID=UPI002FF8BB00